jgi:Recombinase-like helix-turn-helix domain
VAQPDHLSFNPNVYESDPVELSYRDRLGNGLEALLGNGADSLDDLVKGLNDLSVTSRSGEMWTAERLQAEFHRLSI